jgi:hypothetical protein
MAGRKQAVRLEEIKVESGGYVPLNKAISFVLAKPITSVSEWLHSHTRATEHPKANKNESQRQCLAIIKNRRPKRGNLYWVNADDVRDFGCVFSGTQKQDADGIRARADLLTLRILSAASQHVVYSSFLIAPEHPFRVYGEKGPLLWQQLHPNASSECFCDSTRCVACVESHKIVPHSRQSEFIRYGHAALSFQCGNIGWVCPQNPDHALCQDHLKEYVQKCTSTLESWGASVFPFACPGPGCHCPIPTPLVLLLPGQDHDMIARYLVTWHAQRKSQQYTQLLAAVFLPPKGATDDCSWLFEQVFAQHRPFEDCIKECSVDTVAEYLSLLLAHVLTSPCPACGTLVHADHGEVETSHKCSSCGISFCRGCRRLLVCSARRDDLDGRMEEAMRQMGRSDEFVFFDHGCPTLVRDLAPVPQRLAPYLTSLRSALHTYRPDILVGLTSSCELSSLFGACDSNGDLFGLLQPPVEPNRDVVPVSSSTRSRSSGTEVSTRGRPSPIPRLLVYLARLGVLGLDSSPNDQRWTIEFESRKYDLLLNSPEFLWNHIVPIVVQEKAPDLHLIEPQFESRPVIVQVDCTTLSTTLQQDVFDFVFHALSGIFHPNDALLIAYCRSQSIPHLNMRLVVPFRKCGGIDDVIKRDALIERCAVALGNALDRVGILSSRKLLLAMISCPQQLSVTAGEEWHPYKVRGLPPMNVSNQTECLQYMSAVRADSASALEELKFEDAHYPPTRDLFSSDREDEARMPILLLDRKSLGMHRPRVAIRPDSSDSHSSAIWWTVRCLVRGDNVSHPASPVARSNFWPQPYRNLLLLDIRSDEKQYIVRVWGSRYCASGQRSHNNCHPYFIIGQKTGYIRQYCMDSSCPGYFPAKGVAGFTRPLTAPVREFLFEDAAFPWSKSFPSHPDPETERVLAQVDKVVRGLRNKRHQIEQSRTTRSDESSVSSTRGPWLVDSVPGGLLEWHESFPPKSHPFLFNEAPPHAPF